MRAPSGPECYKLHLEIEEALERKDGRCPESARPFLPTAWLPHFEDRALLFRLYEEVRDFQPRDEKDDRYPRVVLNQWIDGVSSSLLDWSILSEDLYHRSGFQSDFEGGDWMLLMERFEHFREECSAMQADWGGSLDCLWSLLQQVPRLKSSIRSRGLDVEPIDRVERNLDYSEEFVRDWPSLLIELKRLADQLRLDQMVRAGSDDHQVPMPQQAMSLVPKPGLTPNA